MGLDGRDRTGFVGLGAMGFPMAKRLSEAGLGELRLFDVQPGRAEEISSENTSSATSASDAATGADVLIVMVANEDQTRTVLFGDDIDDGAAASLPEGSTVVVMSTVGPDAVKDIAGKLSEKGVRLLDAPVSGGVARAETGDLLIMAGGERDVFDAVKPVLDVMGSNVVYCGERVGDGQSVKLVNQLLCGVHIVAAAEALAFAGSLGLDPRFVFETIRHGAANSFMLEDRGERMLSRSFDDPKSTVGIFVKDMGLVCDAATSSGFEAVLAPAARDTYAEGRDSGMFADDDSGIIRLFERGSDQVSD